MKSPSSKAKKKPVIVIDTPPEAKTKYLYVRLKAENDAFIDAQTKSKKVSRAAVVDAIIDHVRENRLM